jgi:hypothetical protein
VLSTGKPGYFAIAVSGEVPLDFPPEKFGSSEKHYWGICGWSGPLPSAEAAAQQAIAKCKERGGADPKIKAQWRDYYRANELKSKSPI